MSLNFVEKACQGLLSLKGLIFFSMFKYKFNYELSLMKQFLKQSSGGVL